MSESPFDNQRMRPGLLMNSNTVGAQRAEPISPVEQAMHRLTAEVDNLQVELKGLYSRLAYYLADIPPTLDKQGPISAIPGNSTAVRGIVEISERIASLSTELTAIKARLEA